MVFKDYKYPKQIEAVNRWKSPFNRQQPECAEMGQSSFRQSSVFGKGEEKSPAHQFTQII